MLTDSPPKRSLNAFADSDQRNLIPLPPDRRLLASAELIERVMKDGTTGDVQRSCAEFLRTASAAWFVQREQPLHVIVSAFQFVV